MQVNTKKNVPVIVIGILLISYIIFIFVISYLGQEKLLQSQTKEFELKLQNRISTLKHFFQLSKEDVSRLSQNSNFKIYFTNKALGMSMQYGLQANLDNAQNSIKEFSENMNFDGTKIYQNVVLIDSDGNIVINETNEEVNKILLDASDEIHEKAILYPIIKDNFLELYLIKSILNKENKIGTLIAQINSNEIFKKLSLEQELQKIYFFYNEKLIDSLNLNVINKDSHNLLDTDNYKILKIGDEKISLIVDKVANAQKEIFVSKNFLIIILSLTLFIFIGILYLIRLNSKNVKLEQQKLIDEEYKEKLEFEINKKTLELKALNDNLEVLIEERTRELKVALEVKGNFLANMSHEIRTPLNAVLGFLHILKSNKEPSKSAKFIDTIEKASKSLLQIIEDILDFSKIESGKISIEKIYFNPVEEFKIVTDLFSENCSSKNINLNVIISKNIPDSIESDPLRIKQVLSNLISNSIKFTEANKSIFVNISYENEMLSVSVKDEGIGIAKNKFEDIFEAFQQEDSSTTRKFGGTGLGLAISRQLINLLGGQLNVKSEVGIGSEFYFTIPAKAGEKIIKEVNITNDYIFNDLKILIAEDNNLNQELISIILDGKNIKYEIVNDGMEAIEKYKNNKYDLILMDENMPNMNGMEATQNILIYEKENNMKHTPIIAFTANAMSGDKEKFLNFGMDDYLSKPVNIKKLYEIIQQFVPNKVEVNRINYRDGVILLNNICYQNYFLFSKIMLRFLCI